MSLEELIKELEELIKENTAALKENTAAIKASDEARAAAVGVARAAVDKAAGKKTDDKAAASTAPASSGESTNPKVQAMADAIAEYTNGAEKGSEERKARVAKIREVYGKVGATKASEVPEDKAGAVAKTIKKLIEEGDLIKPQDADDDDDSDDEDDL